jgi:hypothetical protein
MIFHIRDVRFRTSKRRLSPNSPSACEFLWICGRHPVRAGVGESGTALLDPTVNLRQLALFKALRCDLGHAAPLVRPL